MRAVPAEQGQRDEVDPKMTLQVCTSPAFCWHSPLLGSFPGLPGSFISKITARRSRRAERAGRHLPVSDSQKVESQDYVERERHRALQTHAALSQYALQPDEFCLAPAGEPNFRASLSTRSGAHRCWLAD
jgi:hypothetical protein